MQEVFDQIISTTAGDYDLVIVADFGHGLIGASLVEKLASEAKFLAVNTQSNSANLGFSLVTKYPRADYISVDAPEARLSVSDRVSATEDIARSIIDKQVNCSTIIVTQGNQGCITYERGGIVHAIPAFAKTVVDTVGVGDAFLAMTSPPVAAGGSIHHIGFVGNVVGALKAETVGHRCSIEKPALIKGITSLLT